jgi:hypothetical protein
MNQNVDSLIDAINCMLDKYSGYVITKPNVHIYMKNEYEESNFKKIMDYIVSTYNNSDYSEDGLEQIKDDMNFVVIVLSKCVIRVCKTDIFNKNYKLNYDFIMRSSHSNLEKIYEVINLDTYTYIISKKIIPLLDSVCEVNKLHNIDYDDLYYQMSGLYSYLKENKKSHGDIRLDNIGYDNDLEQYVLFDFDKFGNYNGINEMDMLSESIERKIKNKK